MPIEERLKAVEENLAWLQKDMVRLINIIEAFQRPEVHIHVYNDYRTIKEEDCPDECNGDCDNCEFNQ